MNPFRLAAGLTLLTSAACGATSSSDPGSANDEIIAPASTLTLPDAFFPESIAATSRGTLFTGSPTTGDIVKFDHTSGAAVRFVPPGVTKGTFGLLADDKRGVLWACDVDLGPAKAGSSLKSFRLADGALVDSFPVPTGGACADIARGDASFDYTFIRIEKDAVLAPFNFSDIVQPTDVRAHRFTASYAADPRVILTVTAIISQRPNGLLGAFGATPAGSLNRPTTPPPFDTLFRF